MPPLVGFAISFPFSGHSAQTEYVVNEIWQQQALEGLDDDDEDAERMTITERDWEQLEADRHAHGVTVRRVYPSRPTTSSSPSGTRTAAACSR